MRPDFVGMRSVWCVGMAAMMALYSPVPSTITRNGEPQYFGRIEGLIRDQAGAPIPSAQVRIDGTAYGAVADKKGQYFINNVPSGTYDLTGTFVGFKRVQVKGIRVADGQTFRQDFTLEAQSVDIGDIEVVAAQNQLVPRDEVVTKQRISGDMLRGRRDNAKAAAPSASGNAFTGVSGGTLQVGVTSFEDASVTYGNATAGDSVTLTPPNRWNTEEYKPIYENRFLAATSNPLSTFSIDVDAASYSNVRRILTSGQRPLPDAVRIEEFINYFEYPYPEPEGSDPFSVTLEESAAPWAPEHRLVMIGLQSKRLHLEDLPPSNLVFLIDVSGSMDSPDKLPLVKKAFQMLVQQLRPQDRVAIVVYAGAAGLVLPSTSGSDKESISSAIERLSAGGSTAGGAGIQLAYKVARDYHLPKGNNRVILATDGDFNVGASSEAELVRMIEQYREQGTYLSVLGFGTGNYKDSRMEQLADKGNGNFAYVDTEKEAKRVFVNQIGGTLFTVAKDVKLQLEFNPLRVAQYRLIGYENRVLAKEDFNDDKKDAGELGAGHSVTALYEIIPAGAGVVVKEDSLKYQIVNVSDRAKLSKEWLTLKLRYKRPDENRSRLLETTLEVDDKENRKVSQTFAFASSVAEFGLLLRNSEYRGSSSAEAVIARAEAAKGKDKDGYRSEFVTLVKQWQEIVAKSKKQ